MSPRTSSSQAASQLSQDRALIKSIRWVSFQRGMKGVVVPRFMWKKNDFLYFDTPKGIKYAISQGGRKWTIQDKILIEPRKRYFDSSPLHVINGMVAGNLLIVFYYVNRPFSLGAAVFDKKDPTRMLGRSPHSFFSPGKNSQPICCIPVRKNLVCYFQTKTGFEKMVFSLEAILAGMFHRGVVRDPDAPTLMRFEGNPMVRPNPCNPWESCATFNPAAIYDEGKVHFLYRAIGVGDISVLGYASSQDGVTIDERLPEPAYIPATPQDPGTIPEPKPQQFGPSSIFYLSGGGGSGGCEDPRLTKIDNTVYMTYTAFDGWNSVRMALTSIDIEDFRKKQWRWKKPLHLSAPGEIHKCWVLFPEKIQGKYALLHSISPDILVDYIDDLDKTHEHGYVKSRYEKVSRKKCWDTWVRGAGPPPLKTADGWLVLYHAMDQADPNRYKLGAMLLDIEDPTNVLHRSRSPILEPDEYYENQGHKAGVVYSCGAVIKDDKLIVYYGGADTVMCAASAPLDEFLRQLKANGRPHLTPAV